MTNNRAAELLRDLADDEGFDDPFDLCEAFIIDSVVPCICANGDCGYTIELESDSREGYCPECESHSVISCTELMISGGLDQ